MARLAPCLPLPVHTNCSQVPAVLQDNLLSCTHVSFQAGGYGQGARSAQLAFEVEADDGEEDGDGGDDSEREGLTMVLLVGSTLWFETQEEMYAFLQPKLAAALQASYGYDPSLDGPCMGGGGAPAVVGGEEEAAAVTAVARRRRRRQRWQRQVRRQLLRGGAEPSEAEEEEEEERGDGGIVPPSSSPSSSAAAAPAGGDDDGRLLPSCADVVAAFNDNALGGAEGAASPFAL